MKKIYVSEKKLHYFVTGLKSGGKNSLFQLFFFFLKSWILISFWKHNKHQARQAVHIHTVSVISISVYLL